MSSMFSISDLSSAHDSDKGIDVLSEHVMNGTTYQLVKMATGVTSAINDALYDSTTAGEVTTTPGKNTFRGIAQVVATPAQFLWVKTRGKNITIKKVGAVTVGGQVLASPSSAAACFAAVASAALAGKLLGFWEEANSAGVGSALATLY